ncbi:ABC transporter substrate-binding protein [Lacrimispora sp.]|uniref:ABC transporter substrate-binding protein n=1 Tax=Lacrimispora sp. TaxID=2719234 RepID=UPI00285640B1|nr:ABC transporter substrate-binding protein [Lacrimispora sp.]MDR7811793.1 ABC transporter substrate-binding protein [Lacrimispora sp.]
MRRMKKVLCMAMAVGVTVSSLAGCGGSTSGAAKASSSGETQAGAQSTATGAPIKVGVSNMVTGPMAAGGLRMKQAVTMAFEEINAKGGVLGGRPLEMVLVDDTGTPTGAVNAVNKILGENVSVSIGPHTSPMASATQELYRKAGVPFISAATSPKLLEAQNPYFFRISVSDGAVGPAMVEFAKDQFGAAKVGALYDTDDYGVAADNATKLYCEKNGIEYYSEGFTSGDKDLTSQLSKIKGWGPDVIFDFSHDAEAALIVRQLDELGMGDLPHVGPNALAQSQTYDLCDAKQLEGTYASTDFYADQTNETMKKFLDDFKTRWGADVERYAAMYYTAAYLTADAIERAGSDKPEDIRKALSETKDFNAVFGKLNCSEQGEMNTNLYILEFNGEKNMSVSKQVSLD